MEQTFSISIKGIEQNIIISEWCHVMLLKKFNEVLTADPKNAMLLIMDNRSAWLVSYAYTDHCTRNGQPELFTFEEIKQAIIDGGKIPGELKKMQEIGTFYGKVVDNYQLYLDQLER